MTRSLSILFRAHAPQPVEGARSLGRQLVADAVGAYLPLLRTLATVAVEGWPGTLSLALSPEVVEALADEGNIEAIGVELRTREQAWREEAECHGDSSPYRRVAEGYADDLATLTRIFGAVDGWIVGGFLRHANEGRLDLLGIPSGNPLTVMPADDHLIRGACEQMMAVLGEAFGRRTAVSGVALEGLSLSSPYARALTGVGVRYAVVHEHIVGTRGGARRTDEGLLAVPASLAAREAVVSFLGDPTIDGLRRLVPPEVEASGDPRKLIAEGALHGRGVHRLPYDRARATRLLDSWAADYLRARSSSGDDGRSVLAFDLARFAARWADGLQAIESMLRQSGSSRTPIAGLDAVADDSQGDPVAVPPSLRGDLSLSSNGSGGFFSDWIGPETVWVAARQQGLANVAAGLRHEMNAQQRRRVDDALRGAGDSAWLRALRAGKGADVAADRIRGQLRAGWSVVEELGEG